MTQLSIVRRFVAASLLATVLTISPRSRAVTILSGPTFTPAGNSAPLAGTLSLTTDVKSRISVVVTNDTGYLTNHFYDFGTNHSETLLGFKPDETNQILVTVYDENRNAYTAPQPLTFVTAPLPANFPNYTVLKSEPSMMEPGYTLFSINNRTSNSSYITIMDNSGNVVWYSPWNPVLFDVDVKQLDNGNLFLPEPVNVENDFLEINMLGETVRRWAPPTNYPVDVHDGILTDHGTILYLSHVSRMVTNFPSSASPNPSLITTQVDDNPVVEISATNEALLNVWSPLDLGFLDPTRITYLTYGEGSGSSYGVDNEHANAVLEDTNDNSIIESVRNQNAVIDFSRTGQLKWILSPHAGWSTNFQSYLLTPLGTNFTWNYGQHGPALTSQGNLLLYNDNNYAASPFDAAVSDQSNYSSAVEYDIDETNMTVSEVWNSAWQTNQDRLYTPIVGKTQWLPQTTNVLVTYGYVTYLNGASPSPYNSQATMVRIIEYTHDPVPQVVFDVSFFDTNNTSTSYLGAFCYRAYQIPDLYPHPAAPVADLVVHDVNQVPVLEFSADPTRSYVIQASTDLKNWTTIGTPVQEGGVGDYDFSDLNANQYTTRYYRVVTE